MSRQEQPEQYGRKGEKIVPLAEGRKGHSATTQTENRKPPQGGSGTAPPRNNKGK